jgi:hypothetical protein
LKAVATFIIVVAILASPSSHACDVDVSVSSSSNSVPVKWMYNALRRNRFCGTLISTATKTSGQKDKYHKRGHRDTIVVIPRGLEISDSAEIIYWFHGLTGFKEKTFKSRLAPQYLWLVNNQSWPAILVITEMPWSYFTRTQWKRQGRVFRKPDEFYMYTKEVESHIMLHLGVDSSFRFDRIIIGHSAGGSAIASAAKHGGLCKIKPVGVVFSDSTYGNWFEKAWKGCLKEYSKKSKVRIMVLGQSFGSPWQRYSRWARFNKSSSKRIETHQLPFPWTHGRIGNNAIPFFYYRFIDEKYENIYKSR